MLVGVGVATVNHVTTFWLCRGRRRSTLPPALLMLPDYSSHTTRLRVVNLLVKGLSDFSALNVFTPFFPPKISISKNTSSNFNQKKKNHNNIHLTSQNFSFSRKGLLLNKILTLLLVIISLIMSYVILN